MLTTAAADPLKAPKACYEEPPNVSAKGDYYDDIFGRMLLDSHYSGITAKIDAAIVKVTNFKSAILVALSGADGKVALRNNAEVLMRNDADSLLANVQDVANADPANAIANITSLGISYRTREPYTKEEIEVRYGVDSGSFILLIKKPTTIFAVIWMVTTTPTVESSWVVADFSHNAHGLVKGLTPATKYYFKARTSTAGNVKSAWTQIVDKICI